MSERIEREFDDYLRALAKSLGLGTEEFELPPAHGNKRLRWAAMIQLGIGRLEETAAAANACSASYLETIHRLQAGLEQLRRECAPRRGEG